MKNRNMERIKLLDRCLDTLNTNISRSGNNNVRTIDSVYSIVVFSLYAN